jgi:HK97 family phage portal protein
MPRQLPARLAFTDREPGDANAVRGPRADGSTGVILTDLTSPEALEFFRNGQVTSSGGVVSVESAMRVAVAYRCTHIIAGACGNLPMDLYRRTSEGAREPAVGHPLRQVLQRPNGWQTAAEFRKMLTAHAVLKGDGFALKITARGRLLALWPLKNPDRMEVTQDPATMRLRYRWQRDNGSFLDLDQAEVLHLRGLTLDGVRGVGVIRHAREALGLSLQAELAAARTFRQGVMAGLVFTKSGELSDEAFARLKQQIEENNAGAENARKALILEDDMKVDGSLMSAEDLQFIQSRDFARTDVGMFFGVPPHMYGDTSKASSWGTGIEAISAGFVTYTANDWFVMWEQALERDCLTPAELAEGYYVRLQRQALLRGDLKTRVAGYTAALQWGWMSSDEVRGLEDMNPRPDGKGGQFYEPPNTAGGAPPPSDPPPEDPANANP